MKIQRSIGLILLALGVVFLPLKPSHAQNAAVRLVYTDLENNVHLFDSNTGGLTTLISAQAGRRYDYRMLLSPDNTQVAIYSVSEDAAAARSGDTSTLQHTLEIFSLADGEKPVSEALVTLETLSDTDAIAAVSVIGAMVWSPDGSQLAWVTANPGYPNIHVYPGDSGAFLGLIDAEAADGYPTALRWSPDGTKLAYQVVDTFQTEDGSLPSSGVYIADIANEITEPIEIDNGEQPFWLLGWDTDESLLWSPFGLDAGADGLYRYDVASGESTEIIAEGQALSRAAIDATDQTIAFAVPNLSVDGTTPQAGFAPGAYTIQGAGEPEQIFVADNLFGVNFIQSGLLAVGNDAVIRLSDNTQLNMNLLRRAIFSLDGTQAIGEKESKTFLRDLTSETETEINSLYFVDGDWLDETTVVLKVGAYGSVIGVWQVEGGFTQLVDNSGDGPFVAVLN